MDPVGGCFGYRVVSDVVLSSTRPDPDPEWPVLEVRASAGNSTGPPPDHRLVISWDFDAGTPLTAEVYRSPDLHTFHVHGGSGGWFRVATDGPRISVPLDAEPVRREERLWGLPALLCFLARGDLPLHAAALEQDGRAVLIAGPSRSGKTTLAASAAALGWRLLSEDLSCIRLAGSASVLPGPASLRVRKDMISRIALPSGRRWDLGDDRLHLVLTPDTRGSALPVPLAGIVLLHQGCDVVLERVAGSAALRDLWPLSFRVPETADRARCFHQLAELVRTTPVWSLARPLATDHVGEVLEALSKVADA